jgi:hypothetical protein
MHRIAASLVSKIAASIADRWFDQHVRTAILEGVAGVPVHTWTRDTTNGLKKALAYLNLPATSPWAARDSGLYTSLVRTATTILSKSGLFDSAEELVQKVISGETMTGTPGGELYLVGKQIADTVEADGEGLGSARALILRHLRQRALNEIRDQGRRRDRLGPTVQEGVETDGRMEQLPGTSAYSRDAVDVAFGDFLGAHGPRARQWILDLWARELRPSDHKILQAWLEDPEKPDTALSRELGVSNSFIGKAKRRAIEVARQAVQENPPDFIRDLRMKEELAGMGIGVRRANQMLRPQDFHISYPDPRTIRLLVSTPGSGTYAGFVQARVGPNQVADLVRQIKYAGFNVDPEDIEAAIEAA